MRIKLLLTFLAVFLTFTASYASFPVKRAIKTTANTEISADDETVEVLTPITSAKEKNKTVGIILWLLLGGFAAHRWYYNKVWWANILFILTAGGLFVWAIIDLINIISDKF